MLLADVFNNFRTLALNFYKLDRVHLKSAQDLTWNAGLKKINVNLELLTDIDMYLFIEAGIRGAISFAGKRFAKANNLYIPQTFDPTRARSYILSADANNL